MSTDGIENHWRKYLELVAVYVGSDSKELERKQELMGILRECLIGKRGLSDTYDRRERLKSIVDRDWALAIEDINNGVDPLFRWRHIASKQGLSKRKKPDPQKARFRALFQRLYEAPE